MTFNTNDLLADLTNATEQILSEAVKYNNLPIEKLNYRKSDDSWSVLECFQHLNLYGRYYLPEIKQCMNSSTVLSKPTFKSGLLGNYFANSMKPKEQLNKMKTFESMNPIGSKLTKTVLDEFISQQQELLTLLGAAKSKNLEKVKTGISISKLIRLKLGDTLRVVIYHNQRHIVQANRILN